MKTILVVVAMAMCLGSAASADPLPLRPRPPCTIARMQRGGAMCERCDVHAREGQTTCAQLRQRGLLFRCEGYDRTEYKIYCGPTPRRLQLDKGSPAMSFLAPVMFAFLRRRRR